MDYKEIEDLLERYFEGNSSIAEEKLLRDYFSANENIPSEFEYAKSMFDVFSEEATTQFEGTVIRKSFQPKNNYFIRIAGIAASILLIIGMLFYIQQPKDEVIYAYINGEPITDKDIAIEQTNKALSLISNNLNQGTKDLNYLSKLNEVEQLISKKKK